MLWQEPASPETQANKTANFWQSSLLLVLKLIPAGVFGSRLAKEKLLR